MGTLSKVQITFVSKVCFLLCIQMLILLAVVLGVHEIMPNRFCIFTCILPLDLIIFLAISFVCMILIHGFANYHSKEHYTIRCLTFFVFGIIWSYLFAICYNIIMAESTDQKKTQQHFFLAIAVTVGIFSMIVVALPSLLKYFREIAILGGLLTIGLIAMLIWNAFSNKITYTYLAAGFIIFVLYILVDLTMLTAKCKTPNSKACDPPTQALELYMDIFNAVQKLFYLLEKKHR